MFRRYFILRVVVVISTLLGHAAASALVDHVRHLNRSSNLGAALHRSVALHMRAQDLLGKHGYLAPKALREQAAAALSTHAQVVKTLAARMLTSTLDRELVALQRMEKRALRTFDRHGGERAARRLAPRSLGPSGARRLGAADSRGREKLRASPEALERATDINVDDTLGSIFRIMRKLFGGEAPAESLGVSAKFYGDGRSATARYHVALQPPCECWGLERGAVIQAANECAEALQAPPLVAAWIERLAKGSGPLPSLGFGVSRDEDAGKIYIMNHLGNALPRMPLTATGAEAPSVDAVLPKLARRANATGEPVQMLSLEWKLGHKKVAVRQYAIEDVSDSTKTDEQRLASQASPALAEALLELMRKYRSASEDVAVTEYFVPEELLPSAPLPTLVSPSRSKVGLKIDSDPHGDAALVEALRPGLAAAGVPANIVERWLAQSASVPHSVSNVQLGAGFVTLYRHPTTFGHIDPEVRAHQSALQRSLGLMVRDPSTQIPLTDCEQAQYVFEKTVMWGEFSDGWPNSGCKAKKDALGDPVEKYTCPTECEADIRALINGCDKCALEWKTCDEDMPADFVHASRTYEIRTSVIFGDITYSGSDSAPTTDPREIWESHSGCNDAMKEELEQKILEPMKRQFPDYEDDMSFELHEVKSHTHGISVSFKLQAMLGAAGAATPDEFLQKMREFLKSHYEKGGATMLGDHSSQQKSDSDWSKCVFNVEASVADLQDDEKTKVAHVEGKKWSDIHLVGVPEAKRWKAPYGDSGLVSDMELWGGGCKYPFFSYLPDKPLCEECSSVAETVGAFSFWAGPCRHERDDEMDQFPASAFPIGFPETSTQDSSDLCSCTCADILRNVETYCPSGECPYEAYKYATGATCSFDGGGGGVSFEGGAAMPPTCPEYGGVKQFQTGWAIDNCLNIDQNTGSPTSVKDACNDWYKYFNVAGGNVASHQPNVAVAHVPVGVALVVGIVRAMTLAV